MRTSVNSSSPFQTVNWPAEAFSAKASLSWPPFWQISETCAPLSFRIPNSTSGSLMMVKLYVASPPSIKYFKSTVPSLTPDFEGVNKCLPSNEYPAPVITPPSGCTVICNSVELESPSQKNTGETNKTGLGLSAIMLMGTHPEIQEIGRASCREREKSRES